MLKQEILIELHHLEKRLIEVQYYYNKDCKQIKEWEDALATLKKKDEEIKQGLERTMRKIDSKLKNVNKKSRFRIRYRDEAYKRVYGPSSKRALQMLADDIKTGNIKIEELENNVARYKREINDLERRIREKRMQLQNIGDNRE